MSEPTPDPRARKRENERRRRAADPERFRQYQNGWRAANRDHVNAVRRAWRKRPEVKQREREQRAVSHMRTSHRLRPEDVAAIWQAQGGRCYLCGAELPLSAAVIDHDHRCCPRTQHTSYSCPDCRRGLSCHPCNLIVGHADDDPNRLRRIADALEAANLGVTQRLASRPQATLFEMEEGPSDGSATDDKPGAGSQ